MIITEPLREPLRGTQTFDTAALMRISPEAHEIDVHGHVNNTVYVQWVQEVSTLHWRAVAEPRETRKSTWIVLSHNITYREEIRLEHEVEVRTWLGRAKGPRMMRYVDIRRAGSNKFAARAETDWCRLDAETRKPIRADDALALFDA